MASLENPLLRKISIVCPVYNEEANIPFFYRRLCLALQDLNLKYSFEFLFTNNASTDQTFEILTKLKESDARIEILTFSRNFGYQPSLAAGIEHAGGEAIIVIDVDCQDPPEMLPQFIREWESGFDLVHGIRKQRTESAVLQLFRKIYYRAIHMIADYEFIIDMGDFALFSKRVRDAMLDNQSTFPFLRADLGFVGFKTKGISYHRAPRLHGETHYSPWHLMQFAWGGMLSSTTFFLRAAVYIGFPLGFLNLIAGCAFLFGMNSKILAAILLIDGSYFCIVLSFMATYMARIYKDGVQRPLYIVDKYKSTLQKMLSPETKQAGLNFQSSLMSFENRFLDS